MPDASLADLRQQIDHIDDALHDLLMRRAELVGAIARAKSGDGPPMRPAREALVLRRLIERHDGRFPPVALARIWREIMTAMSHLQGELAVAVAQDAPGGGDLLDLARDHFGSVVPITGAGGVGAVMRALVEQPSAIGILPLPRDDDADPWWVTLPFADPRAPRVCARLPFVRPTGYAGPEALVVGRLANAATDADRGYIAVETDRDSSRARLLDRVRKAGLAASAAYTVDVAPGSRDLDRLHLIEVDSFIAPDDPRVAEIGGDGSSGIGRAYGLGGYALPLTLPATSTRGAAGRGR
jgi:chorismate mutase-like protein